MNYKKFIKTKEQFTKPCGFNPVKIHDFLFDFQRDLVEWSCNQGRSAIFADCGLGKTPMQLSWADNVTRHASGNVLILTPLAVAEQTTREGQKFDIEATHSREGEPHRICVTNYERLDKFNPKDFSGIVLDESSILKNWSGKLRQKITEFMSHIEYRLLCTATPAPNDHMELGTSCEALGIMSRSNMLAQFFIHDSDNTSSWTLKGHAERPFWRWMASWSRAIRKPSDLGYDDTDFVLPDLNMEQHTLKSEPLPGMLFVSEAKSLHDQRAERRETVEKRCSKVAELASRHGGQFLAWCSLNHEGDLLQKMIPGSVQVKGSDSDDHKENSLLGFADGTVQCLITKPKIASFGMNWQNCNQMSFFPSHSHEQFYQAVRRCWRFGQENDVTCHIVTTEAESAVLANMKRKEKLAEKMFAGVVQGMSEFQSRQSAAEYAPKKEMEIPEWLNA